MLMMNQGILPGIGVNMSSTDDVADTAVEIAKHEAHSVEEQHKAHLAWCNRSLQSNAEAFINVSQAVTDEILDEIDFQATIDNLGSYNWYARCLTALFIIGAAPGCTRCARCDHRVSGWPQAAAVGRPCPPVHVVEAIGGVPANSI